ncbi:MAG: hypothetical protein H8F28_12270, partial [Fibrella sp.]|nr:hypothetical protein [Armatimonadota bacterium]
MENRVSFPFTVRGQVIVWLATCLSIFAVFLIGTGVKMLFANEKPMDVMGNPAVKFLARIMRVTPDLHDQKFFVKVPDEKTGKLVRAATPLFLALVVINVV